MDHPFSFLILSFPYLYGKSVRNCSNDHFVLSFYKPLFYMIILEKYLNFEHIETMFL
jgi:hypothetical protein